MAYARGEVIVIFNNEVTKDEAEKFVESYGLKLKDRGRDEKTSIILVEVPEGTEKEWIKKLFEDESVDIAALNQKYDLF